MILRVYSAEHAKFSINLKRVPVSLPGVLSSDVATLEEYDLLHFSDQLINKTRGLNKAALKKVIEAVSPDSTGKNIDQILSYGYDVFVCVSHLKRTILLSNQLGKTAVERTPGESSNLYSAFKRYFNSAKAKAAA